MYTSKIKSGNELEIFTSKLISRETSSSKESLRSTKVDEGKCEDETGVSSLSDVSCFTTKASEATFTIDANVLGVRIMP